jgi:hypothetical protein
LRRASSLYEHRQCKHQTAHRQRSIYSHDMPSNQSSRPFYKTSSTITSSFGPLVQAHPLRFILEEYPGGKSLISESRSSNRSEIIREFVTLRTGPKNGLWLFL